MKNVSALLIWLLTAMGAAAQPQWTPTPVGDSVTVEFPGTPARREMAAGVTYVENRAGLTLLVVVRPEAFAADASATETELTTFYNSVLAGMLEAGGGGRVVAQQAVELSGFPAVQAQLRLNKNARIKGPYFNQVVLVNGTCYAQSVVLADSATPALLAEKDRFFASFATSKQRVKPGDPKTHDSAYQLGRLLGTIIFYGGLAALVFFFLRRKKKAPGVR